MIGSLSSFSLPHADITHDDNFASLFESKVQVCSVASSHRSGKMISTQGKAVDALALSKRWGIPYERAKTTVRRTTQRGVRHCSEPSISRRFPTNDKMMRYPRLPHKLFTDTMIAGRKSARGNKYEQVFATNYGWSRSYGMARKGDAHDALTLLFKREGIPLEIVMDGWKEQTKGRFSKKLRDAGCHQSQIEPYSPWMNDAERNIRELKRGGSRKMISTQAPKPL